MKLRSISVALALALCGGIVHAQSANAGYPEAQLTPNYAADSGSVNALVATVNSCPVLQPGMWIKVLPGHNSTSTTPTINFCGAGTKTITKNGQSALASGDLITTQVAVLIWDGTDMELLNPQTSAGGVTGFNGSGILSNSGSTGNVTVAWTGTAGGLVYFPTTTTTASTAALPVHTVVIGGGSSGPTTTATGTANQPLLSGGASADPTYSSISYPSSASTGCVVYASSGTAFTCNANFLLSSSGIATTYAGLATAGLGHATVLGVSDVTAQSASQTTVNLIASTSAAGHYLVRLYLDQNALCTTGTGSVYATVAWTDATHAHTAQTVPLTLANTSISATNGYIDAAIPLWSATASAITYTTTYGSCASGTGTYDLHAEIERTN